jgi:YegS/Rv2252/BmrU family lipid kinase
MKGLILYNVKAGKGKVAKRLERIVAEFTKEGIEMQPKLIDFVDNQFNGCEDIDLVVICGGDGTINYVVNQMREKDINPLIGVIPAGTANDFAGALGMPKDYVKAARKIAQGKECHVDCGEVNGRYFVNVLSFGVLTTTSQQTSDKAKHRYGKLAYLWVGLKDLVTMHGIKLKVKVDNEIFDANALMFLVFNGETAGRFRLARGAKVDDGLFDILVLEKRNPVVACVNMVRHLFRGKPRAVRQLRSSLIEIYAEGQERTDVDGQPGPEFPMYVRCMAGALRVRK